MGQDFSWPCASREQQRKVVRRRYVEEDDDQYSNNNNNEEYEYDRGDPRIRQRNLKRQDQSIPKRNYLKESMTPSMNSYDPNNNNYYHEHEDSTISPFPFTDESFVSMDDKSKLQVVCQRISNFPEFAENQTSLAGFKLIPSYIIPHIDIQKAIVIMQAVEDIEFIEAQSQKVHRFISKSMDIKYLKPFDCYPYFTKLLKDAASEGLIYIGYYMYSLTEYVFCFYAPVDKNYCDKWLEFEALDTVNELEITKKIEQRNRINSKFKGMISIKDKDNAPRKHLSFLIFEKQPMKRQNFFIVPYPKELLYKDSFDSDLTEKIETNCENEDPKIELAGLISNPECEELYVVFSSTS